MTGSVGAYVAQVDRVLGAGEGLFPASGGAGGVDGGGGPAVPAAPPGAQLSSGAAGAGDDYQRRWDGVSGLDEQTNGAAGEGTAEGQQGRAGAIGVRQSARAQAAAIAPATGSPAGVKLLVSTMDERLAAMQRQIDTTKAQNRVLALRLRQLAGVYRMAGAAAPIGMGGGMGMPSGGGLGSGLGGLGAMPGLSGLARLSGLVNDARGGESERSALAAREGSGLSLPALGGLTSRSGPREVAAAIIKEAQRRGYSRAQTIAILSTAMEESGLNPRAVGGGGAWHSIFQQDSSYRGRDDPNQNIAGFFNRLAARGGPVSRDIWKSIFWLQQAPGASSAEQAYTHGGRQAYLLEIKSQLRPATRLYDELVSEHDL